MTTPDPVATFRQEASDLLETLEQGLLDLSQRPADGDLVNQVFRALHTIKGSGAMFGFTAVAEFVHDFETAFDRVRKGGAPASAELVSVALDAKDHIHALLGDQTAAVPGGEEILERLRRVVGSGTPPPAAAETMPAPVAAPAASGWRIRFRLPPDALAFGTNPLLLLEELAGLGECTVAAVLDDVPDLAALTPDACYLAWDVTLHAAEGREVVEDVFMFIRDGMALLIEPLAPPQALVVEAAASDASPAGGEPERDRRTGAASRRAADIETRRAGPERTASSSLRVAAERLDALMDRVGELVIAQARLSQIAAHSADQNLKAIAEDLERLSSGLRDTTMGIRMVPIGTLFGRFRRLVHDLSNELGKEIEFITAGEETELDKTVIEHLADPLVHLIRNSVDHGLENAARRAAAGKPAKGTVRLSAVYAGAEVAISVGDDGAGLDVQRIRQKAEEAGLLAPDEKISEHDLHHMIFQPGFSTAKEVTSLSGRGVGMDVVKRTIDGLRGSIDLATRPGQGTTATLRLPLTLAIIEGLLVRVGGGRYTIPLAAVEECVELPPDADWAKGRSFLNIRGSVVPFVRLSEVFNLSTPPDEHQKVVIIASGESRVGLVVDQIIGNYQTVIKQLSKLHAGVKNFSGATILGDGSVALILDPMQFATSDHRVDGGRRGQLLGRAA